MIRPIAWTDEGIVLLDQKALPQEERYVTCRTYGEVVDAIRDLTIRGAPAIGVAAAMGIALAMKDRTEEDPEGERSFFGEVCRAFAASRPTAVNLSWAIRRMTRRFEEETGGNPAGAVKALVREALSVFEEDIRINREIGRHGKALIPNGARILTHCNAGALATAGYGTALGVVRAARDEGKELHVYIDETRPVLQGARLTAWEMKKENIPATLITDGMAGSLMARGKVDLVIVGADRIAANGDAANKIGTYPLAVLARENGLPFYVAAPLSTFDPSLPDGSGIPIEERDPGEVRILCGRPVAPEGMDVWNPAFDVTPNRFITAIVTEAGVLRPPFEASIGACFTGPARR
ncbi:MAG TPA: S-methyl-5-thioribose-1-phosphate isomerase [Syntrophales bacterium]|nr:S-methyl-5-thioribose-1-phosphate isomerase [Syntrophales bacterium]HQN78536.1 S-methyl-5-thioribose-1-phosphate isomerase [Syntrophales bacterium]HQQ27422.1 S-methyl-5-thioribose-1-phosphate isomerase [Syntrophales bacterium]